MKNIEKYTNTKDALDAYVGAYRKDEIGDRPFDIWLDQEYVDPRQPTLLEAADDALRAWDRRDEYGSLAWVKDRMRQLSVAIKREKAKPVRNCDKYATAKDALDAYRAMCENLDCKHCRFGSSKGMEDCVISWLYAAAEKEDAK